MPLALRLFEPRYLQLLGDLVTGEDPEFGVVLIERGQEVGGGEARFDVGTMARLVRVDTAPGAMAVLARGTTRFRVSEWLADDPYPQAVVEPLPPLAWHEGLQEQRTDAEVAVRQALALASQTEVPQDLGLSEDPMASSWQLAGLLPVNPLDQQELLGSATAEQLLTSTERIGWEAAELLAMGRE